VLADEDVLQRGVDGVAEVKGAGDVRRRDDDGVGFAGRGGVAAKHFSASQTRVASASTEAGS